jgi:hypothetical protein
MAFEIENEEKVFGLHNEKPRPAGRADADMVEGEEINDADEAFDKLRAEAVSVRGQIASLQSADTALDGRLDTLEAASSAVAFYVDSVNGDDSNSGLSSSAPLQTIAALYAKTIPAGATIYVARGSHFREQLGNKAGAPTGVLPNGVNVEAYGGGPRPLFDCSDVAPNASFTKTAGRTNVYEIAWSHSLNTTADQARHSVWEDGTRLVRVADVATVDATPGSFYAPDPSGTSNTVYVHATGSGDVTANGKVYELARRDYGVHGAPNGRVISVHGRRNGNFSGSVLSFSYARDCIAEDGNRHNFWVMGVAEDCIAWRSEQYAISAGSWTMFISYTNTGTTTGVVYRRCKAIQDPAKGAGGLGFYLHTASGLGAKFASAVYEECEAVGVYAGFSGTDVDRVAYVDCNTFAVVAPIATGPNVSLTIVGGVLNGWHPDTNIMAQRSVYVTKAGVSLTMRGVRVVGRKSSGGLVWATNAAVDIQRCSFAIVDPSGTNFCPVRVDAGSLVFKYNIVSGEQIGLIAAAGVTLESDYNLYTAATTDFTVAGTTHADLAAYRVATGQDANSATGAAVFVGQIRNGDMRVGDASPAWAIGAGADYQPKDPLLLDLAYSSSTTR